YLLDGLGFKFVTVGSYFLGHDKLRLIRLVYQVYLYGFFSIAQTLVVLTIVPISVGMLIKRYAPTAADRSQVYVSRFGVMFLTFLVLFLGYVQRNIIVDAFIATGPVSVLLNLSTMALGYYSSKWFGLNWAQRTSVTLEVGLQNSTLSIFMALTLLSNYDMSMMPAIYTLVMFLSAGILVRIFSAQHDKLRKSEIENSVLAARML
ncbi:bile acid:sodium symporter family protein, partial [Psychrobacter cibarius]|uniref:bile acid:sodium symporter family protein n=2 Tax=Psychrobacter cibarius TaxID=282669 RepID=UPI003B84904E